MSRNKPYPRIYTPAEKPSSWGYILGIMASDGSKPYYAIVKSKCGVKKIYTIPEVSLAVTDKQIVEDFVREVNEVTRTKYAIQSRLNRKSLFWTTTICHVPFVEYLATLSQWGTYTWRVPQLCFSNLEIARGFTRGFFDGDGGVMKGTRNSVPRLIFCSANLDGIQDIQRLLTLFSINTVVNTNVTRYSGTPFQFYSLGIRRKMDLLRYLNVVGINLQRKRDVVEEGIGYYLDHVKWQGVKSGIIPKFATSTKGR